jgi:DNA-binding PadR family transcriptional regulator
MDDDLSPFLPLAPAALHILLALSGEDRHGYGIMKEIAQQTEGKYKPGPGTLYDNLQKLLNQGMLDQLRRRSKDEDERRRYYRLTRFGRRVLAEEVRRLEAAVRTAKANLGRTAAGKAS